MNFETENIEFKSQFTEDIYKEVIAFANTDGARSEKVAVVATDAGTVRMITEMSFSAMTRGMSAMS